MEGTLMFHAMDIEFGDDVSRITEATPLSVIGVSQSDIWELAFWGITTIGAALAAEISGFLAAGFDRVFVRELESHLLSEGFYLT